MLGPLKTHLGCIQLIDDEETGPCTSGGKPGPRRIVFAKPIEGEQFYDLRVCACLRSQRLITSTPSLRRLLRWLNQPSLS